MAKAIYKDSPFGTTGYSHIHKADNKYNKDNPVFKIDLTFPVADPEAAKFKAEVDAQVAADFAAYFEGEGKGAMMTPGERKKWTPYHPYTLEENEEGEPTGEITFHFKQNATIRLKDGTEKALTIGVYDHNSKELFKPVFGGSEARVRYSFRQIAMTSLKEVGTRLDFAMVQVRKLAKGNAQKGFGKVEGYEESEDMAEGAAGSPASEEY